MIIGGITLNKEQYEAQIENARSMYFLHAEGFRMLVGLASVAEERLSADRYWILIRSDHEAGSLDHWAMTATPAERLEFAKKKIEGMHDRFSTVVKETTPEGMHARLP